MEHEENTSPSTPDEDYAPSPVGWVRDQVAEIEARGDTTGTTVADRPVVVLTMRGAKTGKLRKVPLMRVEHDGAYAAVASKGGAPTHPTWYANLVANPDLDLQDGRETRPYRARQLSGDERAQWWERAVEAYPPYAEYQTKTDREIPVFVLEPR
ncbi:nitroreductase family deazaflavin-dependent oxidoreductase [Lapillicoccus jejuensis]|uniref:Deazaflavin-dependent oxidoreductase (Nitroreductase family) n=1 Tax=Lapillicoccus jejuensis TaxID=402171 RepID=A0A542E734_9MICO|nr:nitroreductase family deazaflavin-dependent oxidoreductase [Lapillicoccus jejuensis]TQJ11066.1 deazaflavin-dependent oxidoreductase (nitroreductase family) [Lapillicoccus jejuensis]